jgi:eukaryotic-like serine/threonine-protein kinase
MACSHLAPTPGCPSCAPASAPESYDDTFVPATPRAASASTVDASAPDAGAAPDAPLPRGTGVGRYVLVETLGEGAMGRVYAAFDPELDRKVALKLLRSVPGSGLSEIAGQGRMLREAQAMARLSHPNVVPVHDVGLHARGVFLAMELVEGTTVRDWARYQRPPWREVLRVFLEAGRGLAAAHAAGLVHRDFKPVNAS